MEQKRKSTIIVMITGAVVVLAILIAGTIWMANSSKKDADEAVRTVSALYLNELAGRREQVVENNIQTSIETIQTAVDIMTSEDLSDEAHRQVYQRRMRELCHLERFAFVGESGIIYTAIQRTGRWMKSKTIRSTTRRCPSRKCPSKTSMTATIMLSSQYRFQIRNSKAIS